ncbi:MAG: putative metal-dependent hydrolase [Bacteroidetes bacterium]|nr:putative metal-dependent hydrolase [Bacteroidota bacterium]
METINLDQLRFPIGKFIAPDTISAADMQAWKYELAQFPRKIQEIVSTLELHQLGWRYRPEGWNIRQVIHHCADSHMNAYIRTKLLLTEDNPTIKPYAEALWADLPDTTEAPVEWSIMLLDGVHRRWSLLFNHLTGEQWKRTYTHPQYGKVYSLDTVLALYAWHCRHHLAHITQALKAGGTY